MLSLRYYLDKYKNMASYIPRFTRTNYAGLALGMLMQIYSSTARAEPQENSFVKEAVPVTFPLERCVNEMQCFAERTENRGEFRPQDMCRIQMGEYSIPSLAYRGRIGLSQKQLVASPHISVAKERNAYGRQELVDVLNYTACVMQTVYGARLEVRDLSREGGGRLRPHKSHRTGRDGDVGVYVYNEERGLYSTSRKIRQRGRLDGEFLATQALDANVHFLHELVAGPYEVERIFVDTKLMGVLKKYAVGKYGEEFWKPIGDVLQHEPGHQNHYHIRTKIIEEGRVT